MAKYHKYVFDTENKKFVGEFEEMYKNESVEVFDSWHQEDSRQLQRQINLTLLSNYNFNTVFDLGCGKGAFTHLFKKKNNIVYGSDISPTAIKIANEKFPDINFLVSDCSDLAAFSEQLKNINETASIDLVFSAEVFSYVHNWKEVIQLISNHTDYFLTTLFIPENPIGFVKTAEDFSEAIGEYFEIIEIIQLKKLRFITIFGQSKVGLRK